MDVVQYTVEQHAFLYESYVKCGSARKCQRKFHRKLSGITVPSITGIHKLIKKVRSTGSLVDKKPAKKYQALTKEKQDEIGARLEHTTEITEMPCTRDWHLEIVSSQSNEVA
jgi:hypothetical protein